MTCPGSLKEAHLWIDCLWARVNGSFGAVEGEHSTHNAAAVQKRGEEMTCVQPPPSRGRPPAMGRRRRARGKGLGAGAGRCTASATSGRSAPLPCPDWPSWRPDAKRDPQSYLPQWELNDAAVCLGAQGQLKAELGENYGLSSSTSSPVASLSWSHPGFDTCSP